LKRHGVDFLDAALIFEGFTLTKQDVREDYGEVRFASLGLVDGMPYIVIHTSRGENIRLISTWKASRKDYERYKNSLP
jgi:uncharacterized DUF497 family protein